MQPLGLGPPVPLIQGEMIRKAQGNLSNPYGQKTRSGWLPRWPGGGRVYLLGASWSTEIESEKISEWEGGYLRPGQWGKCTLNLGGEIRQPGPDR